MTTTATAVLNYQALQFWFNVIQFVGLLAVGSYTWWSSRAKVTAKRFLSLETEVRERVTTAALEAIEKAAVTRCERHRERTSSIENELVGVKEKFSHIPTHDDIGRVHARMDDVAKEIDQAVGELRATRRQMDLVLEQLLKGGKE